MSVLPAVCQYGGEGLPLHGFFFGKILISIFLLKFVDMILYKIGQIYCGTVHENLRTFISRLTRSVFFKIRVEAEDIINTLSTITNVIDFASPILRYFEF